MASDLYAFLREHPNIDVRFYISKDTMYIHMNCGGLKNAGALTDYELSSRLDPNKAILMKLNQMAKELEAA